MKPAALTETVRQILSRVRERGDTALLEYTRRFDRIRLKGPITLPRRSFREAARRADERLRRALEESARRVRTFHEEERRRLIRSWRIQDGRARLGQEIRPVEAVGIYVPGGRFAYPSTVLMAAIPARVAGVRRVVVATPPRRLDQGVLAAAALAGVDEIVRVGGPAAIAALAYGTRQVRPVDMIVGPGNALVTEAKRQVFGTVGIDALAGPSELVIIADGTAHPAALALDLEAQAEHDPQATGILISPEPALLRRTRSLIGPSLGGRCRFIRVSSVASAARIADRLAPEHLEIWAAGARGIAARIRHAGAVFIGPASPAVVGDYWAGSSHVLPTARSARFSSGLSVATFLKRTSVIELSPGGFEAAAPACVTLARAEGLSFHERSIHIRRLIPRRKT